MSVCVCARVLSAIQPIAVKDRVGENCLVYRAQIDGLMGVGEVNNAWNGIK